MLTFEVCKKYVSHGIGISKRLRIWANKSVLPKCLRIFVSKMRIFFWLLVNILGYLSEEKMATIQSIPSIDQFLQTFSGKF